ncbi:uncharacterized protein LOC134764425 [Penaeus indicus]|uniref:uncharacterized protein LOC134764425 n=1 Tax=Penaeus indicus TaxID=29960 RepID=UPI00300D138C
MYSVGLVLAAVLITCGPDNANAQVSGTDGTNATVANITNVNTSSSNTGTDKGDSRILEVVMFILLVVMWLTVPFMSWGFTIPATIIFRSIFVDLLGENMFVEVFGGTGGSGPLMLVEDAFRGVFF